MSLTNICLVMKSLVTENLEPELILDCSQDEEVYFWARKFNVSPQAVKTAVRACCNNNIASIASYLERHYMRDTHRLLN